MTRQMVALIFAFGAALIWAPPVFAHPDAGSEAGIQAYLISALIVAGLFIGAMGVVRVFDRFTGPAGS